MTGPDPSTAQPEAATLGWRLRQSLWLLLPILGAGCISGAPLIYLGLRAGQRVWWISGIVYTATSFTGFAMIGAVDGQGAVSDWGVGVFLAGWLAAVVHSGVANPTWLRIRAGFRPWYEQVRGLRPPPRAPRPQRPPSARPVRRGPRPAIEDLPPGLLPESDVYYGQASGSDQAPLLDINTATVEELTTLPGMTRRSAQRVVREREARGGFRKVAELAEVAALRPHEYARLRRLVTCTPRGTTDDPTPGALGRVVDV